MSSSNTERPLALITVSPDGKFHIGKEAESLLSKVKGKVGVVTIAGLYRTGKSYILNRLLNRQAGFEVGPTIHSQTKGIYIWGAPIDHITTSGEKIKIIIVDTEGIGSIEKDETYDAKIFALSVLLSSYFLYNSMSVIDEGALDKLSFITNLTKFIQTKSGDTNAAELADFFPTFTWILRDFALDLVDKQGRPITSKQYLEFALNPIPEGEGSRGEHVRIKNQIRQAISQFFRDRNCITLVRPVVDERDLKRIDQIPYEKLRPEFRHEVEKLRDDVFSHVKPKALMGSFLNGEGLAVLCRSYVDAINKGAVPTIRGAWENIGLVENPRIVKTAFEKYITTLNTDIATQSKGGDGIVDEVQLESFHAHAEDEAVQYFEQNKFGDNVNSFRKELKDRITEEFTKISTKNREKASSVCKVLFEEVSVKIEAKIAKNQYREVAELLDDLHRQNDEFLKITQKRSISPSVARSALAELMPPFWRSGVTRVTATLKGELQQKIDQQSTQLKEAGEKYEKARNEKETAVLAHVKMEALKNQLEKDIVSLKATITELTNKATALNDEKTALTNELKNAKAEREQLEKRHAEEREQNKTATKQLKQKLTSEKEALEQKLRAAENQQLTLQHQISNHTHTITTHEKTIKNQEDKITSIEKEREKERESHQRTVDEKTRLADEERRNLLNEKRKLEDEKKKIEIDNGSSKKSIELLQIEVNDLKARLKTEQDSLRNKEVSSAKDATTQRQLEIQLNSEKEKSRQAEQKVSELTNHSEQLRIQLQSHVEQLKTVENTTNLVKTENIRLETALAQTNQQNQQNIAQLQILTQQNQQLFTQLEATTQQSKQGNVKTEALAQENKHLQSKIEALAQHNQQLTAKMEEERAKTRQNEIERAKAEKEREKEEKDRQKREETERVKAEKEAKERAKREEVENTKAEKERLKQAEAERAKVEKEEKENAKREEAERAKAEREEKERAKREEAERAKAEKEKPKLAEEEPDDMEQEVEKKVVAEKKRRAAKAKPAAAKKDKEEEDLPQADNEPNEKRGGKGKRKMTEIEPIDYMQVDEPEEEESAAESSKQKATPKKKAVKRQKAALKREDFPDPSKLTIPQLKQQLTEWSVTLPVNSEKKQFYVNLYNNFFDSQK